jgi:hypothetical protein
VNELMKRVTGLLLTAIFSGVPALAQQPSGSSSQTPQDEPQQVEPSVPGQPTMPPINRGELPQNPAPAPSNPNAPTAQQPSSQAQAPSEPSGTAAAEAEKPGGNAASRPAGAAIAPAKQRQVRSILLKVGLIAGAAVALGTVYALSNASPGRVPHSNPTAAH